jgi:RNA polymerase sigma-70 factor (ECF subfamily)
MSSTSHPGQELLFRARDGDGDALGQLLERYRHYLVLLSRLHVGRRLQGKFDEADVVQETFLRAHRKFGQFQGNTEGEFVAWLRQVLSSCLVDLIRKYSHTRARNIKLERQLSREMDPSSLVLDQGLVASGSSPSQHAVRHEQGVALADALQQLPKHYREVIILRHIEELSFPEVAERMGRTLDSVKNLWIRALARLRGLMENHES